MSWSRSPILCFQARCASCPFCICSLSYVFNLGFVESGDKRSNKLQDVANVMQTYSNTVTQYKLIDYGGQLVVVLSAVPRALIGLCVIKFYQRRLQHRGNEFVLKWCYILTLIGRNIVMSWLPLSTWTTNQSTSFLSPLLGVPGCILVVIHTFLFPEITLFNASSKDSAGIKDRREKVIFDKRLKIVCIMAVVQLITGISLLCTGSSFLVSTLFLFKGVFSLTEYVLLILLGGHTKLSCDLLLLEKMSP